MAFPPTDDLEAPRITPAVQWLIAINVAVFFLQLTLLGSTTVQQALGFSSRALATSWWTVVTYMFVHGGFLHLALNMYTLYLFGPRVERAWSAGEFTRYYVLCGLGGWLFHLLFARDALLIGASAAVLGVMLAYAMRWPNDEVYLFGVMPVKVKWLVGIMAVANVVAGIQGASDQTGVAYLAHVGGLAAGWLYLRTSSASSGIDKIRNHVAQAPDYPDEMPRAVPKSAPRAKEKAEDIDDVIARSKVVASERRAAPAREAPAQSPPTRTMSSLDAVLDKISRQGIESLTKEELEVLEAASRKLRDRS
ncbi:MAG: rhomboid family intramembrane serine protease [Gemmatimonadaceae bacterium]